MNEIVITYEILVETEQVEGDYEEVNVENCVNTKG